MSQESQERPASRPVNWPPVQPTPFAPPEGGLPLQEPPRQAGSGLLSNWKASQQQQEQHNQLAQSPQPQQAQGFNAPPMPPFQPPQHSFNVPKGVMGNNGGTDGKRPPRKKKRRFPIWARVVVATLAVLLITIGSGAYYYEANFAGVVNNDTGQTAPRLKDDVNPNQNQSSGGSVLSGERMNILLLGSDDDYKSVIINKGVLAQTDIIVSIVPATHSVTMFSLPRDTWLNVPGFGMNKLDQAYLLGGGGANGAELVMATIHQDFGIYIDQYAWVGLSGFTKVIDTVGGIDINVIHPITDDAYPDDTGKGATDPYAVKRLFIPPGPQHLNGLTALEYVRSRHADLVGDIGRSVRQQQILSQLKYKLDTPGIIGQLPSLASDLNGSVKTSMSLQQVFDLMNFARSIDQSKIQRITLGTPYSGDAQVNTSAGVQDVIELNCSLVQPLIAQTFELGNNAKCNLQAKNSHSLPLDNIHQPAPTAHMTVPTSSSASWQTTNSSMPFSTWNFDGIWSKLMGLHSLLDLMFLVTFEQPEALLV